jgi:hypothetical protein
MKRRHLICPIFASLFFVSVSHSMADDLVEGSDPKVKPIKQTVAALVEQIEAGDFAKAKTFYAGDGADLELLKSYVDNVAAAKAMRIAMNAKFGADAAQNLPGIDTQVARMGIYDFDTVIFNDDPDRASSSADSPLGVGLEFERVGGEWKVLSLASAPNTPEQHLARLEKYRSAVQGITKKLNSGEYANADAVNSDARHALALVMAVGSQPPATTPSTQPSDTR